MAKNYRVVALTLLPDGQTSGCGAGVALCAALAVVTTPLVPAWVPQTQLRFGGRRWWVVGDKPVLGGSGDSWLDLAGSLVNLKLP